MDDNKVAVLLEDLMSQFRTFGEGLQLLNDKVDRVETKVDKIDKKLDAHIGENRHDFETNRQEHQQLMQMIKELDTEVFQIKRVK